MYNLRYHLVTICSIFLALAIGLLLGAAISGSNLVRDTSQGLVDSLLEQFNEITKENSDLSKQLAVEQPLTQQLLGTWQDGRLKNRTVVVLTGTTTADAELSQQASQAIVRSGGVPVIITVKAAEFGLTDGTMTESLQQLVPAVDGEPYTTTIGRVLVDEWTFDGLISIVSLDQDDRTTDDSTNGTENSTSSKTTSIGDTKTSADDQAEETDEPDSSIPMTRLVSQYPLTTKLVDLDCISISVNYQDFITANSDNMSIRLSQTWIQANEEALPYAVNGLVNLLSISNDENSASIADPVGLQVTRYIDGLGTAGDLPVYQWATIAADKTTEDAEGETTGGQTAIGDTAAENQGQSDGGEEGVTDDVDPSTLSRFAVLAQAKGRANSFIDAAKQMGLSCITALDDTSGEYSLVALLSGARKGIYGSDRPADAYYPPLN